MNGSRWALSNHGLDENLCELLAVASQFAIALAATLVEYENLVTFHEWFNNFEHHLGTLHCWSSYCYCTVVVNQQYLLNLNSCIGFNILDVVNVEFFALFYLELLTLNFCNYVHLLFYLFRVGSGGEAPL